MDLNKLKEIQAVVFDMDGLMFDSERYVQKSWDIAGERLGYGPLGHNIVNTLGTNLTNRKKYFLEHYGNDFPFDKFLDGYRTNRSNSESILRNGMKVKSSNRKVISTKTFGKDYYLIADNNQVGIGVKLKKTGSTKITAKFKYRGKTYSVKTTVKVIKYSNPFKKIVVDGRDCTSDFKNKNGSGISFMGRNIKITPNKNWRVKSLSLIHI